MLRGAARDVVVVVFEAGEIPSLLILDAPTARIAFRKGRAATLLSDSHVVYRNGDRALSLDLDTGRSQVLVAAGDTPMHALSNADEADTVEAPIGWKVATRDGLLFVERIDGGHLQAFTAAAR